MFVDEVDIQVTAGDGGRGCLSFRREKFVSRAAARTAATAATAARSTCVASPHLNTLVNFRFHPEFDARRGGHGQGSNRTGADGDDLELEVPVGTVVYEQAPETADRANRWPTSTEEGQRVLVAQGGRGGRGNAHFATSTNRAPRRAEPGEPGEAGHLRLQLKLLADVGPRRVSQRRQVHAHLAHLGRQAEDCRLPVHDAHAAPRRRR